MLTVCDIELITDSCNIFVFVGSTNLPELKSTTIKGDEDDDIDRFIYIKTIVAQAIINTDNINNPLFNVFSSLLSDVEDIYVYNDKY